MKLVNFNFSLILFLVFSHNSYSQEPMPEDMPPMSQEDPAASPFAKSKQTQPPLFGGPAPKEAPPKMPEAQMRPDFDKPKEFGNDDEGPREKDPLFEPGKEPMDMRPRMGEEGRPDMPGMERRPEGLPQMPEEGPMMRPMDERAPMGMEGNRDFSEGPRKEEFGMMPRSEEEFHDRPAERPMFGPRENFGAPFGPRGMEGGPVAAEMPKPPSEVIDPKIQEIAPKGLDTTDVGNQGNWLLKRVWYEQAEEAFGKLLQKLDSIIQQQIKLFKSVTETEKKSESVFKKSGLELDDIDAALSFVIKEGKEKSAEKEAKKVIDVKELVVENVKNLEDLQKQISQYRELEASVNDVVNQVISQVNRSRKYQQEGWSDFKEIGNTLNDDKAKKLYYKIEGYLQTLNKVSDYLSGALQDYLNNVSNQQMQAAESISNLVKELEKKELNISEAEKTFKDAKKLLEEEEEREHQRKVEAKKKEKVAVKKSWYSSILDWFASWF